MVRETCLTSLLFVPANRPERFAKAAASGADALILDLEDAVAPADKVTARLALHTGFCDMPLLLRINAADTPWHEGDLTALAGLDIAAIMLPKAEDPAMIDALYRKTGRKLPVFALIETARGLAAARQIASHEAVARLVFGSIDFCADIGCAHRQDILLPIRSELVLASRLAGLLPPIDGVTANFRDVSLVRDEALHASELGMGGKLCIHPGQIEPVRAGFAPSRGEISWARNVLATGDGVAALDGVMIDQPVRLRAQAILAKAARN